MILYIWHSSNYLIIFKIWTCTYSNNKTYILLLCRNFFELVRFDFVLDEKANVYLMEVRITCTVLYCFLFVVAILHFTLSSIQLNVKAPFLLYLTLPVPGKSCHTKKNLWIYANSLAPDCASRKSKLEVSLSCSKIVLVTYKETKGSQIRLQGCTCWSEYTLSAYVLRPLFHVSRCTSARFVSKT